MQQTIAHMFLERVEATPNRRAYSAWTQGAFRDYSFRDYEENARNVGLGLMRLGLAPGDKVAILGQTRAEWAYCDIGAICVGGVTVGLYPTLMPEGVGSMEYILNHSESRFLFVENLAVLKEKIAPILRKLSSVSNIFLWDADDEARELDPRISSLAELMKLGAEAHAENGELFRREALARRPSELALLIYTSGTTGQPKGAMLSHGNVWALQDSLSQILPPPEPGGGHTVSFLPMAHAAERCVAHYGRIKWGTATHFARSMESLLDDIAVARPTRFGSVPRIFEKVYAAVQSEIAKQNGYKGSLARAIYQAGLDVGAAARNGGNVGLSTRVLGWLFDKKIGGPLRERFGGQCEWFISGAAPIAVEILEFFDACGFKTYEAYGLTEATGIVTANHPESLKYGTVGKPIPNVEVWIASDGEILVKGPIVFQGYFQDDEATREALADGWLRTGDIGFLDDEGFLRVTDRKKNIVVTAAGKNITPSNIENEVKNHPLIAYCHLHADRRPFPTALICLDHEHLAAFAKERGLPGTTVSELKDHPVVLAEVQAAIDKANAAFASFERIKKFAIVPTEFSIDGGELTPTLKVKRREVEQKYASVLERLYE